MIDRRLVRGIDWVLLGATLLLALIGVVTVYSATHRGSMAGLHVKQLYLVAGGLVCLLLAMLVDYRRLADRAILLYLLGAS
ncbi:MAG TPA: rod shape-determining protein RodA, partial [Vicinamibacteria bacterium]